VYYVTTKPTNFIHCCSKFYYFSLLIGVLGFLEFGDNRKSITNLDSPDAASEPISLPSGFPFGSEIHTLAYVSVDV